MTEHPDKIPPVGQLAPKHEKERGKVGLVILMWLLGVPTLLIVLYAIFG